MPLEIVNANPKFPKGRFIDSSTRGYIHIAADIEAPKFGLGTFTAFPDLKRPVVDLVAEGDRVVARWTSVGTHDGVWMGIPPSGKEVRTSGITIFRLGNGKIVEEWSESDMRAMLQQVGALPGPPA